MNKVNEQIWNLLVLLKEPKRTRQHAINNTNQSHSALQNGRNGLIWFVAADAARPVSRMSEVNEAWRGGGRAKPWKNFSFWMSGGGPGWLPALLFSLINQQSNFQFELWWLIEEKKRERPSPPSQQQQIQQINSRNQNYFDLLIDVELLDCLLGPHCPSIINQLSINLPIRKRRLMELIWLIGLRR